MRKIVLVVLIIVVLGIVGFFAYTEFSVPEITYVSDYDDDSTPGYYSVKRLYSTDIDIEALDEKIENLISLEFTEEEIMKAALEAGRPVFYPCFYVTVSKPSLDEDEIIIRAYALQELAEGQKTAEFGMTNLRAEIITNGITITEASAISHDYLDMKKEETVLKNESGTGMTVSLGDYGETEMYLKGTAGTMTIQFVYDIKNDSLLPKTVTENCFLKINLTVTTDENGRIETAFTADPASTVEEYMEGE